VFRFHDPNTGLSQRILISLLRIKCLRELIKWVELESPLTTLDSKALHY
jgi:hypothetical protein